MQNSSDLNIKNETFIPPFWARNQHAQSLLATLKFRKPNLIKKSKSLLEACNEVILDAGDGVRLQSFYSKNNSSRNSLVILIHGWEGSHESLYLLSAANHLYQAGYDILRLNLRDHGSSHQLNEELFHSNRLQEVINAVKQAQDLFKPTRTDLVGFSLGGNFVTRISAESHINEISLNQTIAICPAINPLDILIQLENGLSFYHDYFVKKWKRSLKIKQSLFPKIYNFEEVYSMKSMRKMTEYLLLLFGDYHTPEDYFNGYSLGKSYLEKLNSPVTILMSKDDPVINYQDTFYLSQNEYLNIHSTQYGGHCGFIKNLKLQSWADDFILKTLTNSNS